MSIEQKVSTLTESGTYTMQDWEYIAQSMGGVVSGFPEFNGSGHEPPMLQGLVLNPHNVSPDYQDTTLN